MPLNSPKRPPYWNSTSGFNFDHITAVDMSFCTSVRNFIQIWSPSAKTIKRQSKQQKSPLVYQSSQCLHRVRRIHKAAQTLLRCYLAKPPSHVSGQWPQPVVRGQGWLHVSTWTSMRLAAACCYTLFYLLMMPAARLVCQRPSSNFPFFGPHSQTFCSPARTP